MPPLQVVWPKDGPQGSRPRGFFGGMKDIMTGRGPDMFLQRKGSRTAIKPGEWGNWDGYHDPIANAYEQNRAFTPRGLKRYDPHTRKYRTWSSPNDFFNQGVDFNGPPWQNGWGYPHFTEHERRRLHRMRRQGPIDPLDMGPEWTHLGPKRFRGQHDWFWQEAHQVGNNVAMGVPWPFRYAAGINPLFHMSPLPGTGAGHLAPWIKMEVW